MDHQEDTSYVHRPPAYTPIDPLSPPDVESHGIIHQFSTRSSDFDEEIEQESSIHPDIEEVLPPPYKPPTFTTDGINITYYNSDILSPQYRLTHNIFSARHGVDIGLSRLLYTPGQVGASTTSHTAKRRPLYNISTTSDSARTISIEGCNRKHSYKELYLGQENTSVNHPVSADKPWRVAEKDKWEHVLEACPGSAHGHLHLLRHRSEEERRIQWQDGEGNVIAIEHRAVYSTGNGVESAPTLEVLVELGEKTVGLLLVAWIARAWQEAMQLHHRHLTIHKGKS